MRSQKFILKFNIHPQYMIILTVYDCWMNIRDIAISCLISQNLKFLLKFNIYPQYDYPQCMTVGWIFRRLRSHLTLELLDEYWETKFITQINIYPQSQCMTVGWIFRRLRSHPTLELLTSFAVSSSLAVFMMQIIIGTMMIKKQQCV